MTDIAPQTAELAALLDAGARITYAEDTVWGGHLFADLRDAAGRLIETGSGASQDEAVTDLERRLARPETAERAAVMVQAAAETPEQLREALQELNDENLDLQDEVADLRRTDSALIHALIDALIAADPDSELARHRSIDQLLDAGCLVSLGRDAADGSYFADAMTPAGEKLSGRGARPGGALAYVAKLARAGEAGETPEG